MSFLAPLALLFGLLAGPIILMYMLRLRRREVVVSSTFLWQSLVRDREANAPWQRLRRNLLLILQLIILTFLVFALARPFLPVPNVVNRSVVVLLDGSASMQATDVEPSRFVVAQEEVNGLIRGLSGGNQMTLIQVGGTPQLLATATNDKRQLFDAVAVAQPSNGAADWSAAFALAAGAAQGFQDARVIILSDGGLPADLPPLPADVLYVPIGRSAENLAISALATRATSTGIELFASVTNAGQLGQQALLTIQLGETLFDARQVSIAGGETANYSWELGDNPAVIRATLSDQTEDYLSLDDVAVAVHEGGVTNRTLLVTSGNIFIEQALAVLPGLEAFKAPPDTDLLAADAEPFDLYVLDGVSIPEPLPAADLLIVNPPVGENELLTVSGVVTGTQNTTAIRLIESPLLQFVDWNGVNIRQIQQVEAPWARPLVEASAGPLVLIGERGGHRIAILTFDLQESDLPLQIAFPILMANLTSWLSPGRAFDAPSGLKPSDIVTIVPNATALEAEVLRPDGQIWRAPFQDGQELIFAETDEVGLYVVNLIDSSGSQAAGQFAINLFTPQESAIAPATTVLLGSSPVETTIEDDVGRRELWLWLAVAAFAVLLIEWWVYHRGARWPEWIRRLRTTQ